MPTDELLQSPILNNKNSANHIGCAPNTLKQSRNTGILCGVTAPPFLKMGNKAIRYKLSTLDEWLAQFNEYENTAQTLKNNK